MTYIGVALATITTLLIIPPFFLGFAAVAALPFSLFGFSRRSPSRPRQEVSDEEFHAAKLLDYPAQGNGSRYKYANFRKAA
ncbi:MAG: hypothetical protein ACXWQO_05220 [Bdellovibrionota bacterium]